MRKLPKYPKGLKARLKKAERKAEQAKKIKARKSEIAAMRKKLETLQKKSYE